MTKAFDQQPEMSQFDTEIGSASLVSTLRTEDGELINGTPTVVEFGTNVLEISQVQISGEAYLDRNTNRQVEIGQAVVWQVKMKAGQEVPGNWIQRVTATTTRGRTIVRDAYLRTS